jgi:hypothetical protein
LISFEWKYSPISIASHSFPSSSFAPICISFGLSFSQSMFPAFQRDLFPAISRNLSSSFCFGVSILYLNDCCVVTWRIPNYEMVGISLILFPSYRTHIGHQMRVECHSLVQLCEQSFHRSIAILPREYSSTFPKISWAMIVIRPVRFFTPLIAVLALPWVFWSSDSVRIG